jgi:hypothetical protein
MTRSEPVNKFHAQHHFCVLPILLTLFLPGAASALDFKGVELGDPLQISVERSVFGKLDCNPMKLEPDAYQDYLYELRQVDPGVRKVCNGSTSIAAVPAEVTVVFGSSRRVLRLTFQFAGEKYSQIFTAMMDKWGEGVTEERDPYDKSAWWDFDDGSSVSVHLMPVEGAYTSTGENVSIGLAEYALSVATPAGDL